MMDDAELELLERGMRALLTESGLGWVRASIEDGIAAGTHTDVSIPRRSSRGNEPQSLFDEDGFQYKELSPSSGGRQLIGNVRLSQAERVTLITQAIRRLIVELPEIHQDTMKRLAPIDDEADTAVAGMEFVPDEDDAAQAPPSFEAVMTPQARAARRAAVEFLAQVDRVISQ
jgi:hypothetical protein